MPAPALIAVDSEQTSASRVNIFVHGYRSMASPAEVEAARLRVQRTGVTGASYLFRWMAGSWGDSATFTGLRAAAKAGRIRYALSPMSLLIDAGVIGLHEVAQFKRMERRAEQVGRELPSLIAEIAEGRPVNLIGHSLGARVVHQTLRGAHAADLTISDVVLLAGAADLDAADWEQCVRGIHGTLYNLYSPRDRILRMTPDLRRRIGCRPLPDVVVDGVSKVVNHASADVSHVAHWTQLAELLPKVWTACQATPETEATPAVEP
ncbi:DUF726 domain-containing protein [Botrimarina mediterranea]|uniref:Alpha/beta hydrolase family protein n=1 Tax=Botrimarina mediterranea TaxID=2528022 RepID=A0A518KD79_9BACT|nr:DUF726 domain-containing protein [Botrimarina mediterranea]QDV75763.1 hypothetical protein Spa11_39850 [Botrimarina mediterranea]QDV80361.1 hypothetical protein K2D_39890 [Planctomycetes bacterium K2D]